MLYNVYTLYAQQYINVAYSVHFSRFSGLGLGSVLGLSVLVMLFCAFFRLLFTLKEYKIVVTETVTSHSGSMGCVLVLQSIGLQFYSLTVLFCFFYHFDFSTMFMQFNFLQTYISVETKLNKETLKT